MTETPVDIVVPLEPNFAMDLESVEDNRPPHLIICIHGIRDTGAWCSQAAVEIEYDAGFVTERYKIVCAGYDRYSTYRFLLVLDRHRILKNVLLQIDKYIALHPTSKMSLVCHSNGAKIATEIAKSQRYQIEWIVLGGSVCHRNDWRSFLNVRRGVVNDAATLDWWPIWAECFRPRFFQATGVYGFNQGNIIERMYRYRHGDFVKKNHLEKWVIPIIARGAPERTKLWDVGYKKHAPTYIRRAMIVIVIGLILYFAWSTFGQPQGSPATP